MSATYRLACACGVCHSVTTRQAGQTLVCQCGAEVSVPPLRDLRQLERDAPPPTHNKISWSTARGGTFAVGLLALLGGLIGGGVAHYWVARTNVPTAVEVQDHLRERIEGITAEESWNLWLGMRELALKSRSPSPRGQFEQARVRLTRIRDGSLGLATLALAMLAALSFRAKVKGSRF